MKKNNILKLLTSLLFYLSILFFFIGFNFQDSRTGGWIQQFLPLSIGDAQIRDITFVDSLTGFAVTGFNSSNLSFILKTSNGGNDWTIKYSDSLLALFQRVQFINKDTGYTIGYDKFYKTFNSGENWTYQILPNLMVPVDFCVLNKDTIWLADAGSLGGGLYRTTNGGQSWINQYSGGTTGNPNKIYMYNARIGFMSAGGQFLKTTNSGANWTITSNVGDYYAIYFSDSLTGYHAKNGIRKTTNGGFNWQNQILPTVIGSTWTVNYINKFSYIKDTLYGVQGNFMYPNLHILGIVYKTTNGGNNWGYQIPDTSWRISIFDFAKFIKGLYGWCYTSQGIFTTTGGDTTIYTSINNTNSIVPKSFILFQNYPNPFNPLTNIKYQISKTNNSIITIKVFDISGKEIETLVNKKQSSGTYEVKFYARNLSSGIYFYTLFVNGVRIDTKKAVLIK